MKKHTHTHKKNSIFAFIFDIFNIWCSVFFSPPVCMFSHFILLALPKHLTSLPFLMGVSERTLERRLSFVYRCIRCVVCASGRARVFVTIWHSSNVRWCSTFLYLPGIQALHRTQWTMTTTTTKWKAQRKIEWNKNNLQPYVFIGCLFRPKKKMFTLHLCNCVWLNKKIIKQILYALGLDRDGTVYHRAMQMGGKKKRWMAKASEWASLCRAARVHMHTLKYKTE